MPEKPVEPDKTFGFVLHRLAVSKGRAFGRRNERSSFFAERRNPPYEGASAKGVNKTTQASFQPKVARGERSARESVPLGINGYYNLCLAKQPGELFCNKEQFVFIKNIPLFVKNYIMLYRQTQNSPIK